jgi:hypothetical protein
LLGQFVLSLILNDLNIGRVARRTYDEILPRFQVKLLIGDRLVAIRTAMGKLLNDHLVWFIHHGHQKLTPVSPFSNGRRRRDLEMRGGELGLPSYDNYTKPLRKIQEGLDVTH